MGRVRRIPRRLKPRTQHGRGITVKPFSRTGWTGCNFANVRNCFKTLSAILTIVRRIKRIAYFSCSIANPFYNGVDICRPGGTHPAKKYSSTPPSPGSTRYRSTSNLAQFQCRIRRINRRFVVKVQPCLKSDFQLGVKNVQRFFCRCSLLRCDCRHWVRPRASDFFNFSIEL